jgi:hypothetical protein
MSMLRRPTLLVLAALALASTAGACKDDPPTPKLFQEAGTWSVIIYDLEGNGEQRDIDVQSRRDAFMLSFDTAEKVVQSAACIETDSDTVADSLCLLNPDDTHWSCRCFAYDFVREEQLWREFNAGDVPPVVKLSEVNDPPAGGDSGSGSGGGGGDGGGGDGDTLVNVSEIEDVNSTFNFRPLPLGVFGSNGESSRFVMQKRADSQFDRVFEDPEGRPGCEPCVP